jgi:hypothetical protein
MALEAKNKPTFASDLINGVVHFTSADTAHTYMNNTNLKIIITAGVNGALIDAGRMLSDDTITRNVILYVRDGSTLHPINVYVVTLAAGTNGTTLPIDPLSNTLAPHLPVSNQGKRYIRLMAGQELVAGIVTLPTAGKFVSLAFSGGEIPV